MCVYVIDNLTQKQLHQHSRSAAYIAASVIVMISSQSFHPSGSHSPLLLFIIRKSSYRFLSFRNKHQLMGWFTITIASVRTILSVHSFSNNHQLIRWSPNRNAINSCIISTKLCAWSPRAQLILSQIHSSGNLANRQWHIWICAKICSNIVVDNNSIWFVSFGTWLVEDRHKYTFRSYYYSARLAMGKLTSSP